MVVDTSSPSGKHVERRLRDELIIWLTTVRLNRVPEPSPVWFLWDGQTVLVYSQPGKLKLTNIQRNPNVALHFDGDGHGGDIVILTGNAVIDHDTPPASDVPAYVEKYRARIAEIGMTPETFAGEYSVPIRITPTKLRSY